MSQFPNHSLSRFFPVSRPKAPSTLEVEGAARSGYRDSCCFCAIDRLPALCEVCRSRMSSSGASPRSPAASSGGGELVSSAGWRLRSSASSRADSRLLIPAARAEGSGLIPGLPPELDGASSAACTRAPIAAWCASTARVRSNRSASRERLSSAPALASRLARSFHVRCASANASRSTSCDCIVPARFCVPCLAAQSVETWCKNQSGIAVDLESSYGF
jgi:hypothetical protein